jgi:hypothetical protein
MPSPLLRNEAVSSFVMPAKAGIQSVEDLNNFKNLDSRPLLKTCRDRVGGNDGLSPIATQPRSGGEGGEVYLDPETPIVESLVPVL